jgi:hypothetical protein
MYIYIYVYSGGSEKEIRTLESVRNGLVLDFYLFMYIHIYIYIHLNINMYIYTYTYVHTYIYSGGSEKEIRTLESVRNGLVY